MAISIVRADLGSNRELIIEVLSRCLTDLSDGCRFDWLYANCPYGEACAWLVADETSGSAIGAAAAFPRRFYLAGNSIFGWVLGDFCLDPQYRSVGPALQLQRACFSVLEQNQGSFCYDFPNSSMLAVYKRLGFSVTEKMLRLAKPLRVDRKVREMVRNPAAQRVVASVGNTLLKVASSRAEVDETWEISLHQGPCDYEFTALAEEQREKFGICLERSAEYLNWRYVNNPLVRNEIITARKDGRLGGYAVWVHFGEDVSIVDLFGEADPGMVRSLIAEITALAQRRGVMTLSVLVNESHPWLSVFTEMGFRVRDSVPVVIIPSKTFAGKIDPRLTGWYLMQGDRDS
jgi:hypothetical protein